MASLGGLAAVRLVHSELQGTASETAWQTFTPAEAAVVEAMTGCIIPADDAPGARQAGVVRFIDRWIARYEPESKAVYAAGIKDVTARTATQHPRAASFAALPEAEQVALLTAIERTDFFGLMRGHAIMGYLGAPSYGGNRGEAGWKAIGFQNHGIWQAPFGWYDREENRGR
jgi:gluconate 2-dehydrogenase gamma chain